MAEYIEREAAKNAFPRAEELVKRLRKRAINLKEKFSRNAELLSELMQAADAIEELSREVKSLYKILVAHPDPKGKPGKPGVPPKEETE